MENNEQLELKSLKLAVQRQANRIASLMLDLDLAYSQIEIMNSQLNKSNTVDETEAK